MDHFRFVLDTVPSIPPSSAIPSPSLSSSAISIDDTNKSSPSSRSSSVRTFTIRQESTREIGFKLYPGALELCSFFQSLPLSCTNGSNTTNTINNIKDTTVTSSPSSLLNNAVILELGSGVCAIPTLAINRLYSSSLTIATDMPTLLPLLEENLTKNNSNQQDNQSPLQNNILSSSSSWSKALPLTWGIKEDTINIRNLLGQLYQQFINQQSSTNISLSTITDTPISPDIIIAADVIYHDPLIEPLLQTLIELTNIELCEKYPSPSYTKSITSSTTALSPISTYAIPNSSSTFSFTGNKIPIIIISYVQRFKRAKQFFKLAKKYFDIDILHQSEVIDYDVLTWLLPITAKYIKSSIILDPNTTTNENEIIVTPQSARYDDYLQLLITAGNIAQEEKNKQLNNQSPQTNQDITDNNNVSKPIKESTKTHHIDSDSDDEWDNNEGYTQRMMQNLTVSAISMDTEEPEIEPISTTKSKHTTLSIEEQQKLQERQKLIQAAKKGAAILGVPFVSPSQAYIYLLRRKIKEPNTGGKK